MRNLFLPAVAIMNQMRFTQKFGVMGVLVILAITSLSLSLYFVLDDTMSVSKSEMRGLDIVRPVHVLIQKIQQHRGLSAAVLAGNQSMKSRREDKEQEVEHALGSLMTEIPAELRDSPDWKISLEEWRGVQAEGLLWTVQENFSRHTLIISALLQFMTQVGDKYQLTQDPEIDSSYLIDTLISKAPVALERLGQMRARGTAILTRKQMSEQQRADMAMLVADLNNAMTALAINLEKTARYNTRVAAQLKTVSREFNESTSKVVKVIVDEMMRGEFSMSPQEYFALTTASIDQGYAQLFEQMIPTLKEILIYRVAESESKLRLNAILVMMVMGIVGYFSVGAYYATMGSIRLLSGAAKNLAAGDLRCRIPMESRDELNLVANSFNEMADAFSQLLNNVQSGADQVAGASRDVASSASNITNASESQSQSAASMAGAIQQMTVGIDHISKNAADAKTLACQAGELSVEGGSIVGTVIDEITMIADSVRHSANIIDELGRQSQEISDIVNVIKEIADQTNLLALNAAIEAARAGDSGRGFAVVADEVRMLAERTTKSTQRVSVMIHAIQSGTQSAVVAMRSGVERVEHGVKHASQAGEAMSAVQMSAEKVMSTVTEISSLLREQSAASAQIAKNVEIIAYKARDNSRAVAENAQTAQSLERLAELLQTEVRRFKVS